MGWMIDMLSVALGFVLLSRGAALLVDGGSALAKRWGVRPFVVGLTVVAWGTSLPEVVVSALAAAQGRPATSLGNVIGSNIANIGMVIGAASIVLPAVLSRRAPLREGSWLLGSLLLLWGLLLDGKLQRWEAIILIATFVAHTLHLFLSRGGAGAASNEELTEPSSAAKTWFLVLIGSAVIYAGAQSVMWGGTHIADRLGMGDTFLGLTILAIGSSLPELFACLTSARKGEAGMSLGNVIGSNVFNTLAVTGVAGALSPFGGGEQIELALARDFPACLGFTLTLLLLPKLAHGILNSSWRRLPGFALLLGYAAYLIWISVSG